MDEKRQEWDALSESERNCLMWPDFVVWKQAPDVKIHRKDPSDSLGLVSVTVQVSSMVITLILCYYCRQL